MKRNQKTKVMVLALAAVLATGCQSRYEYIETSAASAEGPGSVQLKPVAGPGADSASGSENAGPGSSGTDAPGATGPGSSTADGPGAAGPGSAAADGPGSAGPGSAAADGPGSAATDEPQTADSSSAGSEAQSGPGSVESPSEGPDAAESSPEGPDAAESSPEGPGAATAASDGSETEPTEATTAAAAFTDVDETVYVTARDVNVRAACSTESEIIAKLNRGASLKRTGTGEEWSRVLYQDQVCYISSQYLTTEEPPAVVQPAVAEGEVRLDPSWQYAEYSKINSGAAILYKSEAANRKNITVCVNAGHGTSGGSSVKTLCHPDGTPKVTGGSTAAGATTATAVSGGMVFSDGTPEPKVTLAMAMKLKPMLLEAGYDVLMIRETDDVQLDNIARTVIANNAANCHIALHWDSTTSNKGAFYMSVPSNSSYRSMEPVSSHWQEHNALGDCLISGLRDAGVKIFSSGAMEMDLTQTSYSTVPSIDIELGDKVSDYSDAALQTIAEGLLSGINAFFGQ